MNLFNRYRSRKYLVQILLSSLLIMLLFVTVSSGALMFNAQKNAMKMLDDSNRKVLSQVAYNIDFTNNMFIQFLISLYFDNDVNVLMKRDDLDFFDITPRLYELDKTTESTNYLNSILVYNGKTDTLYNSGDFRLRDGGSGMSRAFRQLLDGQRDTRKLMLIPVEYDHGNKTERVLSMLMYDSPSSHQARENAIVINIKPDWIMNNLIELNKPNGHFNSTIVIVDGQGTVYQSASRLASADVDAASMLAPHLGKLKSSMTSKTIDGPNGKWVATPLQIKALDWQVVTLQSYDEVMSGVRKLRQSSVAVVLLFLVLAVVVTFISSHRLYKPVEELMRQFRKPAAADARPAARGRLEFSVINDSYKNVMHQLNTMQQVYGEKRDVVKSYYLQRLLTMKDAISESEFCESRRQYNLRLEPEGPYVVVLLSINLDREDNKLMHFAVANIAKEIVGNRLELEMIELNDGTVSAIVSLSPDHQGRIGELNALLQETQEVILHYYRISVTAAVSREIADYRDFAEHHAELRKLLAYRLVFGEGGIITAEAVKESRKSFDPGLLEETEKRLIESMKAGHTADSEKWLNHYFHYLKNLEIEHIDYGVTRLILTMSKTLQPISAHPGTFGATPFMRRVMQQTTLDDMKEMMLEFIWTTMQGQHTEETRKHILLTDTIKDIVRQKYADPNLSLQCVSDMLKMSPTYVGRIFKGTASQSFADYLNEVRLELALQLLNHDNHTIKEIMERVGYTSQSNFFRLFKMKYGAPPKEYRFRTMIGKSD
ncbi:AraC family transcriptional regulator [Cohnella silvisoli]|uniref:AraC family transcriptional regulator n=1 Tax=Cohnella silvisoli TaxID=2873699 RepID=A0ABV1L0I9_9BACL|nr:AraC family transcriptional regulator [Cohnella silvisoli]MCD9025043.1 AraC family transcriptional regulator [Cohnella silvisoli]